MVWQRALVRNVIIVTLGSSIAAQAQTNPGEGTALRPSIDCQRSSKPTEKAVCASRPLMELDGKLAKAYAVALSSVSGAEKEALRAVQRKWIVLRDACAADAGCLKARYETRIRELNSGSQARIASSPSFDCQRTTRPAEAAVCGSSALKELDGRLSKAYAQAMGAASSVGKDALRAVQRKWLFQRDACAGDVNCLQTRYQTRIAELASGQPMAPAPAEAESCESQTAFVKEIASHAGLTIDVPSTLASGGTFRVEWRMPQRVNALLPVYIIAAVSGPVRFQLPPSTKKDELGRPALDLPGFLALTEASRAPFGLTFGEGNSRMVAPLHYPGSALSGSASVQIFEAGPLVVKVAIAAINRCGEHIVLPLLEKTAKVLPGAAEIAVQDPYDIESPKRILISKSGRYRAHVFDGRYRVFDTLTGAKLIDRAGHNPNFSPTGRFVVADILDQDGLDFEVIDLVARDAVANPRGPFTGWTNGDAFLIDGQPRNAEVTIQPALFSRLDGEENPSQGEDRNRSLLYIHDRGCLACASWESIDFRIDSDSGVVVFFNNRDLSDIQLVELASGRVCCEERGDPEKTIQRDYGSLPFRYERGWHSSEPIQFTHVYESSGDVGEAARALAALKVSHNQVEQRTSSPQGGPFQGNAVRGDWRLAGQLVSPAGHAGKLSASLQSELTQFGLFGAQSLKGEEIPFSNAQDSIFDTDSVDKINDRSKVLGNRLARDVPIIAPYLKESEYSDTLDNPFPRDGAFQNGIFLAAQMEAAWRWQVGDKPVWLLQLMQFAGVDGTMADRALLLLEGGVGGKGRIVNLYEKLKGFWASDVLLRAQVQRELDSRRLKARLFRDRYLILFSKVDRTFGIYDIAEDKELAVIRDIAQTDLLSDIVLTADNRHVLQINSDGQFFLYSIAQATQQLAGRYVDGEIILYTSEGYYWSSYEGAHFVQVRFPGLRENYTFKQFATALDKPDIVKAKIAGSNAGSSKPKLLVPPSINAAVKASDVNDGGVKLHIFASSAAGLARLSVYQDGQLVLEKKVSGLTFEGIETITPAAHARWLTLLATDANGFVSTPWGMRLSPHAPPRNTLHAILIGVDKYDAPEAPELRYAVSDSRRLAAALRSEDGGAYYGSKAIAAPLLDDQATSKAILEAIDKAVSAAKPEDTILFSFSGHGVTANGKYYMLLKSTNIDDLPNTALPWSAIADKLQSAKARVVVLLDSCQSGFTGRQGLTTNEEAAAALLSGARAPILVLAASKGRQEAEEHEKWGGGLFTYALVEVLKSKRRDYDLNGNGVIEVSELYKGLRAIVARESNQEQTPWLARQDLVGDFALF